MPLKTSYIEKELLAQVAGGDENAFGQLFHTYHQELADYIFYLTRSQPLMEEIVQDSFTKIWVHRERLLTVTNFRSYLFTISRNHTFNSLRSLAREVIQKNQWALQYHREMENSADMEEGDRQLYYKLIEDAVEQLPPQQQKAYLLSRQKGLRHEEIASQLQLSRETVKRHISLALRAISSYVRAHAEKALLVVLTFLAGA